DPRHQRRPAGDRGRDLPGSGDSHPAGRCLLLSGANAQLSRNVTFRLTRYAVTWPFSTTTLWSLTHAETMPLTVSAAFAMPARMASSKPFGDSLVISMC